MLPELGLPGQHTGFGDSSSDRYLFYIKIHVKLICSCWRPRSVQLTVIRPVNARETITSSILILLES